MIREPIWMYAWQMLAWTFTGFNIHSIITSVRKIKQIRREIAELDIHPNRYDGTHTGRA